MADFMLVSDPYYRGVLERFGYDFEPVNAEIKDRELSDAKKTAMFNAFVRAFNLNEMINRNLPIISVCSYLGVGNSIVGITRDEEAARKACMSMSDAWVSMHCAVSAAYKNSIATECETLDMRMKHIDMDFVNSIIKTQNLHEKPGCLSIDFVKEWNGDIGLMKGTGRELVDKALAKVM
jgi:predicted house-cleaning NTP pyrophosphatase (Maf/HAM1 superfamily)